MSFQRIRRREFIAGLGGAVAWPLVARAQGNRMWRIGVLMTTAADDPEGQSRIAALMQGLQQSGLSIGGNVQIDVRFGVDQAKLRKHAGELAITSDVIVAAGSAATGPLLRTTRTVPIVFAMVADPVGAGFVDSLARPGGNATGFTNFEYDISGKWLALLKELAPAVTRAAVIRDPTLALGAGQFGSIQAVAPSLRVEVIPVNVGDDTGGMERAIAAFVRSPNGGLIVTGSALVTLHRKLIIALAAQHRLPAIYPTRFYAS
jgi:putative ABC transport system substrate-binding protein